MIYGIIINTLNEALHEHIIEALPVGERFIYISEHVAQYSP
jgi:hypothetical protein